MIKWNLLLASAVMSSSLTLAAQKTLIVDVNMGKGYTHQYLAAAFKAAKDGDTIVIRKGNYPAATTSKSLTLLGEGRPTIGGSLQINSLRKNQSFTIEGVHFNYGRIFISNCNGIVSLANLTGGTTGSGLGVTANNAKLIMINRCNLDAGGGAALSATNSTIYLVDSSTMGMRGIWMKYGSIPAQPAIASTNSNILICGGTVQGGGGTSGTYGITHNQGFMLIAGSAKVLGGNGSKPVVSNGGVVHYDTNSIAKSAITGKSTLVQRNIPVVSAQGAAPNGTATVTIKGRAGDGCFAAAGLLLRDGVQVPGLGFLRLDTRLMTIGPIGKLDQNGQFTWKSKIPNISTFRGYAIGIQAVIDHQGTPGLSEPTIIVLN